MMILATGSLMAQGKKKQTVNVKDSHEGHNHAPAAGVVATSSGDAAAAAPAESISFAEPSHNFGSLPEGPSAEHEFVFTNTGKEPIVIQRVQASCGCTTPSYTKEPVAPGQKGSIKAAYNTSGRPGAFTKTLTVFYNVGSNTTTLSKTLTISGSVDKAPSSSVPENSSMMKLN